jgi:O-antigen/teichoic acid export membrane protein
MTKNKMPSDASTTSRNLMGAGFFKIIQIFAALLFAALIPRTMGAENYGEFSFLISIVTIAGSLVTLAVSNTFGRFFPEFKENNEEGNVSKLFMNMLFFKICFTLFVCLALMSVMIIAFGDVYPLTLIVLMALIVLFTDIEATFFGALFGHNKIVYFSAKEPIRRLMSVALIFVFFGLYGLHGAIFASCVLALGMALTGLYLCRNMLVIQRDIISFNYFKQFLMFGLAISGAWILTNIWGSGGNILVKLITNNLEQVAYFDISQRIFQIAVSISLIFINSLIPIFTKLLMTGKEQKISQWSRRIMKYTTILNVIIISGLFIIGHDFIRVFIGKQYADVNNIAIVMMFSIFPFVVTQMGYVFSVLQKKPKDYFLYLAISVTVFTVFSLILVPNYAAMGCAISNFIAYTILGIMVLYKYRESMRGCIKDMAGVMLIGTIASPLLLLGGDWIQKLLIETLYAAVFMALLLVFRLLEVSELKEIVASARK